MLNYGVDFWNDVYWTIKNYNSEESFISLVNIDWTESSSNIISIDASSDDIWNLDFLEQWIDWVIMTWLNDIDKNRFEWKAAVWSILWVDNWLPIIWSNDDWSVMFNFHGSYKSILWNGEELNPGIIYNLISQLQSKWINPSTISKVHLWYMAWKSNEVTFEKYQELIENISKEYKIIDFNDYFYLNSKVNNNKQLLGYIDINWIVDILLKYHWVSMYNIEDRETNIYSNMPYFLYRDSLKKDTHIHYNKLLEETTDFSSATIAKLLV